MKNNGLIKIADQKIYFPPGAVDSEPPNNERSRIVEGEYWPLYNWLDMLIKPWGETTISRIALLILIITVFLFGIFIGINL